MLSAGRTRSTSYLSYKGLARMVEVHTIILKLMCMRTLAYLFLYVSFVVPVYVVFGIIVCLIRRHHEAVFTSEEFRVLTWLLGYTALSVPLGVSLITKKPSLVIALLLALCGMLGFSELYQSWPDLILVGGIVIASITKVWIVYRYTRPAKITTKGIYSSYYLGRLYLLCPLLEIFLLSATLRLY